MWTSYSTSSLLRGHSRSTPRHYVGGSGFNLTRAAARLASPTLGKARTATVRRTLIQVAGRIANQARRWRLHLPSRWPWQDELDTLYTAALGPPILATS